MFEHGNVQSACYRNRGFLQRSSFAVKYHHGWKSRRLIISALKTVNRCFVLSEWQSDNFSCCTWMTPVKSGGGGGGGGTSFFLHWNQSVRDIYQSHHISRWIVEVVKTAYQLSDEELPEKATANELSALASLWAYSCHIALEDVLFATFWWSSVIFQKNYLRDLALIAWVMAVLARCCCATCLLMLVLFYPPPDLEYCAHTDP